MISFSRPAVAVALVLSLSSCSGDRADHVQANGPTVTVGVTKVVKKSLGRQITLSSAVVSFREGTKGAEPSWIFPDGAKRPTRVFISITTLLLLIALGAWFSINVRNSTPRSMRFLIPEGYSGWVRIEFEVSGAPALPEEAGQTLLQIPPSGTLRTSSLEQYGWVNNSYGFYSSAGVRPIPDSGPGRLIWGKINGEASGASGKRKYEEFFVGTQQRFRDQVEGVKHKLKG